MEVRQRRKCGGKEMSDFLETMETLKSRIDNHTDEEDEVNEMESLFREEKYKLYSCN